ncbi:hypothetical protein QFZ75_002297 [Streptomyces sp. V3I8]|nr:hypothetical protein [Streptomyces sp. V3I8]
MEVDAASRAPQLPQRIVGIRPRSEPDDLQPLVDRIGRQVPRDLERRPGLPVVPVASARWITVSCAIRRARNPAVRSYAQDRAGASAPAARKAPAAGSAPSASQASSAAGSLSAGP